MGIGQNLLSWVQGELIPILSVVLMVTAFVQNTLDSASLSARHARILQQAAEFKQ